MVAPISLLENWMAEYACFFNGCLRVRIVSTCDLEMLDWSGLGAGDVLLVNYEGMVRAAVPMAQVDWSVVASSGSASGNVAQSVLGGNLGTTPFFSANLSDVVNGNKLDVTLRALETFGNVKVIREGRKLRFIAG